MNPTQQVQTTAPGEQAQPAAPAYESNPFSLSFRGFELLIKYAQSIMITALVLSLVGGAFNLGSGFFDDSSTTTDSSVVTTGEIDEEVSPALIAVIIGIVGVAVFFVVLFSLIFTTAYNGTIAAGMLASSRHEHITFGQAFTLMKQRYFVLFFATFLAVLRIIGGYLLFIIPGIRAQLRYNALPFIVMEQPHLSATQAVNECKRLYKNHLMESLGISSVGGLIPIVGPLISSCGYALSQQQIRQYKDANLPKPPVHILNYLVFGLIIFLFLLVLGLVALTVAIFGIR